MGFWSKFASSFEQGAQIGAAGAREGLATARENREWERRRRLLQGEQWQNQAAQVAGLEAQGMTAVGQVDLTTPEGARQAREQAATLAPQLAGARASLAATPTGVGPGGPPAVVGPSAALGRFQQVGQQAQTIEEAFARFNPNQLDNEDALENYRQVLLSAGEPPDKVETSVFRQRKRLDREREEFFWEHILKDKSLSADAVETAAIEYGIRPGLAGVVQLDVVSRREREKQDQAQLGLAQAAGARAQAGMALEEARLAMNTAENLAGIDDVQAGLSFDHAVNVLKAVRPDLAANVARSKAALMQRAAVASKKDVLEGLNNMLHTSEGRVQIRMVAPTYGATISGKEDESIPMEEFDALSRAIYAKQMGGKPVETADERATRVAGQYGMKLIELPEGPERDSKIDEVEAALQDTVTIDGPLVWAKLAAAGALQRSISPQAVSAQRAAVSQSIGQAIGPSLPGLGGVIGAVAGTMIPSAPKPNLNAFIGPDRQAELGAAVEDIVGSLQGRMTEGGSKSLRPQVEKMLRDYTRSLGDLQKAIQQVKRQFRLATP